MKLIKGEQAEYNEFMAEVSHKVHEMRKDFDKLSDNNKARVKSDILKIAFAQGTAGLLKYLDKYL